jgi:alkylation response protein AidB-like acyl-CoA dehydrogenase
MNFEPTADQAVMAESFARFFNEHSSMHRVRAALPTGFDPVMWREFAALGGLGIRVPETSGGSGLGLFDAVLLMEEVGRTLASGPIAEAIIATRMLAYCGDAGAELLARVLDGRSVVTLALHDVSVKSQQWVGGGAVADAIVSLDGSDLYVVDGSGAQKQIVANLGSAPTAKLRLDGNNRVLLTSGPGAVALFRRGVEEWKLLIASALAGMSREALRLASAYASEREQFGQPIGTFQGISHPLADLMVNTDGGKFLVWRALREIADETQRAGAGISLALWWNATVAGRAVAQALHTFGGYGLTLEYDIHLYNLRAKAWPLVLADPASLLSEGARRLYADAHTELPEVGEVPINFDFGEDARALESEVHAFFNATLTDELRAKAHYSFDGHDSGVHRKLAEARLLFPAWPEELGGRNVSRYADSAALAVWQEQEWSTHAVGTTGMVGAIIHRFGSDQLKREVLTKIVAGEVICSLGFSEPGSGSDVFAAKTRAARDGDGWRIDGQKMFTSGANIADYVLMLARTDPEAAKHKGLTMFIVSLKSPGIEIQPIYTFMGERTNATYYDGVHVPDAYRLGEVNAGVRVMSASLELEHGGSWAHSQWRMLREAESYCSTCLHEGRPKIAYPAVAERLAKVTANNMVTDLLYWRAMWAGVEKKPNPGFGSMSKLFSSEAFRADSADLLDLCAPESLIEGDGPAAYINLSYRHAQGTTVYGGTSEIHRSVVAERALNLPRTRK